jgi:hypothetical protein
VFPTLAFASYVIEHDILDGIELKDRLIDAWGRPEAWDWEIEVEKFVSRFPGARPVDVADGTLILQQEPVSIEIVCYPQTDIPWLVEIHVYQRRERTKPEEIARRYEEKLSAAGIACDVGDRLLPMSADPFEGHAIITVPNHKPDVPAVHAEVVWRGDQPRFQHPEGVREYCEFVIGSSRKGRSGFATSLNMRGGKGSASSKWLVPACVVLYLREIAQIGDNQEIYRLLNDHVYREVKFRGDGLDPGDINTLWEYVDKYPARVQRPLLAAWGLFDRPR